MKAKYYAIALAPLCIIGACLRIFEILFAIESETGFYIQNSALPIIFNVFVALVLIFYLSILPILKKEKKPISLRFAKITLIEKIAISCSTAAIFLSSFMSFWAQLFPNGLSFSADNITYIQSSGTFVSSATKATAIALKPALTSMPMLMLVFSIFAVIFTLSYILKPKKTLTSSFYKVISLSFLAYYIVRLFAIFIDSATILSRAYGAYTILFLCATVLFFMNYSKMLIQTPSKKFILSFGFCAIFLGAVRVGEFIIWLLPNNPHNINVDVFAYIADFATVLAILSVVLRLIIRRKQKQPSIEDVEPEKQAPVLIDDDENVNKNERMI